MAIVAAGSVARAADDPKVTWNYAVWGPKRTFTASIDEMAKQVGELTKGAFTITIHYGEVLVPAKEVLDGIKIGAFESAAWYSAYAPGKTPAQTGLELPFLPFPTLESVRRTFDAYMAQPVLVAELARWNARYLFSPGTTPNEVTGRGAPPHDLSGWKGKRVRAGGILGEAFRALGAAPANVPSPEFYISLERGVIDAIAAPVGGFGPFKLYEVASWYTTNVSGGVPSVVHITTIKAWDDLPAAYRKAITDSVAVAGKAQDSAYEKDNATTIKNYQDRGRTAVTYTPPQIAEIQRIAGGPVWDAWAADMTEKGLPGKALLDFLVTTARKFAGG
jgi:TRAP-type C4-dicarboxylate transport system substrate-binding protein